MLKFFRNIRKKLLSEGKTARYMKYAFGEIVLVVIGILIALSINNWNTNRLDHIKEQSLLIELKSDYLANVTEIEGILNNMIAHNEAYERIFDYLDHNKPIDNNLKESFSLIQGIGVFNSSNTTYKFIENNGINLLRNPVIRKDATILYDEYFSNIVIRRDNHYNLIINNLMPFLKKEFIASTIYSEENNITRPSLNVPINVEALTANIEFRNTLIEIYTYSLNRKFALEKTLNLLNDKIKTLEENIQN